MEYNHGIPRNPLINAGAIVICDILISNLENPKNDFLQLIRELSGNKTLNFDSKTAESEKLSGFTNIALINLMKSFKKLSIFKKKQTDPLFWVGVGTKTIGLRPPCLLELRGNIGTPTARWC